jgi:DHA1 family bicyclomycin/chloramphenicol resistance-like MFS transporter
MRRLVTITLGAQVLISTLVLAANPEMMPMHYGFALFLVWQFFMFAQAGLTLGNLNAIAMEPMGHIAGMAASVIGSVSTIVAAVVASAVAQAYVATMSNLVFGVLMMSIAAFLLMLTIRRETVQVEPAE